MNSIVITGSTGFVGRNLIQKIHETRIQITNVVRSIDSTLEGESMLYDDFWNCERNYNTYIHLAGKAHDLKNVSDDSEYFEVNFELTKRFYDRFLEDEASKKFIYISSVKAVADELSEPLTEKYDPRPVTAYGRSKLKAEEYLLANQMAGKQVYILRPCMIHGPSNKGNLNELFQIVKKNIPWPLGAFENKRSFLSIDNFCYVMTEILNSIVTEGIYNLADDEPLSTNEIVEMMCKQLNRNSRIINVPKSIIKISASIGNILSLPLNEERLQKLTENYMVSNMKIVCEIGKPLPVSAQDGMRKTIQYLIEENA